MNLLLDTHVFLWWLWDLPQLGAARKAIVDPGAQIFVSAVTSWEIAIKMARGQLNVPEGLAGWLPRELERNQFLPLSVEFRHTFGLENLPMHHRDPFDRLLIAQAAVDGLTIITADPRFQAYDVRLIQC